MQGTHARVGSILGANPGLLQNHAQAVKDWCKARMQEASGSHQSKVDGKTHSVATNDIAADGPYPPNRLVFKGRETTLQPIPWRLIQCMWAREMALEIDVCNHVWPDGDVGSNGLKIAITKANKALQDISAGWTLGMKTGYVRKKFPKSI